MSNHIAFIDNQGLECRVYLASANLGSNGRWSTTRNVTKAARFKSEDAARRAASRVFRSDQIRFAMVLPTSKAIGQ